MIALNLLAQPENCPSTQFFWLLVPNEIANWRHFDAKSRYQRHSALLYHLHRKTHLLIKRQRGKNTNERKCYEIKAVQSCWCNMLVVDTLHFLFTNNCRFRKYPLLKIATTEEKKKEFSSRTNINIMFSAREIEHELFGYVIRSNSWND